MFKNTNTVFGLKGCAIDCMERHIQILSMTWAISLLQLGRHITETIFTHIEISPIKPIRVIIVIGHEHFRHGDFIGDRAQSCSALMPNAVQHRALAGIEAQTELPALPINKAAMPRVIDPLRTGAGNRAQRGAGFHITRRKCSCR